MNAPRKVRGDSVLATLPEERQAAIEEHARTNTLAATIAWLAADGVKTSRSALSGWLQQRSWRSLFKVVESDALTFMSEARKRRPDLSESDLESFGNDYFQMQAVRLNNPELFLEFRKARTKAQLEERKLGLQERRIVLLEAAAKKAAATEEVLNNSALNPEEQAQRIREIFKR